MAKNGGWWGIDLDGTIALHAHSMDTIGEPVPAMVAIVKEHLARGEEVRICTARVGIQDVEGHTEQQKTMIEDWCLKHIGVVLPVTCSKDYKMLGLYDDRAIQVIRDTGLLLQDLYTQATFQVNE